MSKASSAKAAPLPKAANVNDRKRARRAHEATATIRPIVDLSRPDARRALAAVFPRVLSDEIRTSTETEDRAALAYLEARDAKARAQGAQDYAGNVLCAAIGEATGIEGEGWRATWKEKKGDVDWSALCKDLAIPDETIAKYRKASYRVIDVRETVETES